MEQKKIVGKPAQYLFKHPVFIVADQASYQLTILTKLKCTSTK